MFLSEVQPGFKEFTLISIDVYPLPAGRVLCTAGMDCSMSAQSLKIKLTRSHEAHAALTTHCVTNDS